MDTKSQFKFGGGKGCMEIDVLGAIDYTFEAYDETISVFRPKVHVYNIVMGTMYIDFYGEIEVINHATK